METKKLTVNLPEGVLAELKRLAELRNTTITSTLRRAIATESFVTQELESGGKLLIQKPDATIREIVIQ
jgi:predicted transcriptional regulator